MKLTQGQKDTMASYLEDAPKKTWYSQLMGHVFGYVLAFGSLGALACQEFFGGPEWVGNVGTFFFVILMLLSATGLLALGSAWTSLTGTARKKFLFSFIRTGRTQTGRIFKGLLLYIPAFVIVVGGGMWWLTTLTTVVYVAGLCITFGIFSDAYATLDKEMASKMSNDELEEGIFTETA